MKTLNTVLPIVFGMLVVFVFVYFIIYYPNLVNLISIPVLLDILAFTLLILALYPLVFPIDHLLDTKQNPLETSDANDQVVVHATPVKDQNYQKEEPSKGV